MPQCCLWISSGTVGSSELIRTVAETSSPPNAAFGSLKPVTLTCSMLPGPATTSFSRTANGIASVDWKLNVASFAQHAPTDIPVPDVPPAGPALPPPVAAPGLFVAGVAAAGFAVAGLVVPGEAAPGVVAPVVPVAGLFVVGVVAPPVVDEQLTGEG